MVFVEQEADGLSDTIFGIDMFSTSTHDIKRSSFATVVTDSDVTNETVPRRSCLCCSESP